MLKRKLFWIIGSLAVLLAVELTALFFMKDTLSESRSLMGAEGLWAKGERDAVYRLTTYGYTQDEDEYKLFLERLAVPMAYNKARLAVTQNTPDLEAAKEAFKAGQVPTVEIDGVIRYLTRFKNLEGVKKSTLTWAQGDTYLSQLQDLGNQLHAEIKGESASKDVNKTLDKIYLLNENLNVMEDNLSFNIQAGVNDVEHLLMMVLGSIVLTIWFIAFILVIYAFNPLTKRLKNILRVAQKVSISDFTEVASMRKKDEIGRIGESLNKISNTLRKTTESLNKKTEEQKSMELVLQTQRGLYDTLLKAQSELGEGICITEGKKIMYVNEAICKISGYTREELDAMPAFLSMIIAEGTVSSFPAKDVQPPLAGLGSGEMEALRKDGEKIAVEYRVKNLFMDGRNQTISIIRDITERKRYYEQLHQERERAESAEIARQVGEQFLANMSHEIRTPMNAIVGFTDVLMKTPLSPEQQQCTDAIKTSGDNLLVIINDILDFSRMHSGKLPLEKKDFKLTSIISNCIELMLPKAMEKGLQLSSTVDKDVPNNLIGDPTRLTQVLINLVSNSLKFTERGYVSISVRKIMDLNNEVELEFSVKDTGIGISPDKQASIFDAFIQADNATARKYGGTGLGLAIVKQLADLQGGSIHVTSKLGEGSCFYYRIAYGSNKNVVPAPAPSKNAQAEERNEISFSIKDLKVLVVEDNAINQLLIKKILSKWGWQMDLADNGLIAIQLMEKNDYDIVLMDIQLPEMNGYDASIYIRKKMPSPKRNIPIIAMTANVMASEEARCYSAGMNDYISKPFDSKVLYTKVVTLLNKKNTFAN